MTDDPETFGNLIRRLRLEAGLGLRELARLIERSPGYLSDVELGNVPPPSESVIVKIAAALNVDRKGLLNAAEKMDPELADYVARRPQAADFLRMARDKAFDDDDWQRLSRLAEISRLGKPDKDPR
jgi:transcriptional regulator with XRE-family HTH domain